MGAPAKHELSRTEIGRIADVLEVLVARHGGTIRRCAPAIGAGQNLIGDLLRRPAALNVVETGLDAIAAAAGGTRAELLAGRLQLSGPRTAPPRRVCAVLSRRGAS